MRCGHGCSRVAGTLRKANGLPLKTQPVGGERRHLGAACGLHRPLLSGLSRSVCMETVTGIGKAKPRFLY
jgi:hypothetical protein